MEYVIPNRYPIIQIYQYMLNLTFHRFHSIQQLEVSYVIQIMQSAELLIRTGSFASSTKYQTTFELTTFK